MGGPDLPMGTPLEALGPLDLDTVYTTDVTVEVLCAGPSSVDLLQAWSFP